MEKVRIKKGNMIPKKILYVEDNLPMLEFFQEALHMLLQDLVITAKPNAQEALEVFTNDGYDLLIADIELGGGMNGVELIERFKQAYPNTPIMVITAYNDYDSPVKGLSVDAYVVKPVVDFKELSLKIKKLLES